jgi:hypothetical protein
MYSQNSRLTFIAKWSKLSFKHAKPAQFFLKVNLYFCLSYEKVLEQKYVVIIQTQCFWVSQKPQFTIRFSFFLSYSDTISTILHSQNFYMTFSVYTSCNVWAISGLLYFCYNSLLTVPNCQYQFLLLLI